MELIVALVVIVNIVGAVIGAVQKARNAPPPVATPPVAPPRPRPYQTASPKPVVAPAEPAPRAEGPVMTGFGQESTEGVSSEWATPADEKGRGLTPSALPRRGLEGLEVKKGAAGGSDDLSVEDQPAVSIDLSPARLREAVILAEILGPPRALRPYRPFARFQ